LNKYLGFLEDIVIQTIKFKEEKPELEDSDIMEINKIVRGRTRINAHPQDVKRDLKSLKES